MFSCLSPLPEIVNLFIFLCKFLFNFSSGLAELQVDAYGLTLLMLQSALSHTELAH